MGDDLAETALKALLDESIVIRPTRDMIRAMAKELLRRREEAKTNDAYIEDLQKQLEPCTCQGGNCLQHD